MAAAGRPTVTAGRDGEVNVVCGSLEFVVGADDALDFELDRETIRKCVMVNAAMRAGFAKWSDLVNQAWCQGTEEVAWA